MAHAHARTVPVEGAIAAFHSEVKLRPCTSVLRIVLQDIIINMDENYGEWVECMGVANGCGYHEAGVASGSGWNLWMWLAGSECV